MNLAALKYRNCLAENGGPIATLETVSLTSLVLPSGYEAYATLKPELKPSPSPHASVLYGSADGSGTSIFSHQARYKAISEALERWAFYETAMAKNSDDFGFAVDRSTTGMAAFPGVLSRSARKNAYQEAAERWSLGAWWSGLVSAERLQNTSTLWQGVEIRTASFFPEKTCVVLLWLPTDAGVCYGFSSAPTRSQAIARAQIELDRNRRAISDLPEAEASELGEKRLLYFAQNKGHTQFLDRVSRSLHLNPSLARPKLIVDTALPGPWSEYCHVWRCLFEPVSDYSQSERLDTFLF